MMEEFKVRFSEDFKEHPACIKIVGIGGGGGNAVNRMVFLGIKGVEFISANTDAQALRNSLAPQRIQIGVKLTKGLGVGGDPVTGRRAAEEDKELFREILHGADMVFITAGMGGGTGTGGAPIIAQIAKEQGSLTVGVVTKPFMFEGKIRAQIAEEGIKQLKEEVDTLIVIPNQKLFSIIDRDTPSLEAYKVADDVLRQGVQSISDVITSQGLINVDFADVRAIMSGAGESLMGIGLCSGQEKALRAAQKAITSPLLEDVTIDGAKGVLVNITAAEDIKMSEIDEAMSVIHEAVSPEANIYFGQTLDLNLGEKIKVTVIAAGIPSVRKSREFVLADDHQKRIREKMKRQIPENKFKDLNIPAFKRIKCKKLK